MDASACELEFATALEPEATAEAETTFVTALEDQIERSKSHWSELTEPIDLLSREEATMIKLDNEKVFKALRSHPKWGFFYWTMDNFEEFKVGEKFAEGAQAELYNAHVRWWKGEREERNKLNGRKWAIKVFKEGTLVRDLSRQWPHGILQHWKAINEHLELGKSPWARRRSHLFCALMLEDGRFAFLMGKEDEDLRGFIDRVMLEDGHNVGGPFAPVDAEDYMCDVALGVDVLHRYDIVHRDLKASNVLVKTNADGDTYCYVSDYECSIGVVGTRWWRAPEILQACKERNVKDKLELFSKGADIYSLGMVFYEILTGMCPFQDEVVTRDLIIEGKRPYVPEFVGKWAQQLLHWCWEADCSARPSIEEILEILEANSSSSYIKFEIARRAIEVLSEEETLSTKDDGSKKEKKKRRKKIMKKNNSL